MPIPNSVVSNSKYDLITFSDFCLSPKCSKCLSSKYPSIPSIEKI